MQISQMQNQKKWKILRKDMQHIQWYTLVTNMTSSMPTKYIEHSFGTQNRNVKIKEL